jgi:hypothetical protein
MQRYDVPCAPSAVWLLIALLVLFGCAPLRAQADRVDRARTWPVDSVLARLEADVRANLVQSMGARLTYDVFYLGNAFAPRQDSLLDGLERLALTSDNDTMRREATSLIAFAGQVGRPSPPVPGVFPRLLRIYRSNTAWLVRALIRDQMPEQAERRAAAAFLRSIAAEPDTGSGTGPHGYFAIGDPRTEAVARLAEMGEEGRSVLQAMHRNREARSPQVRIMLDDMARRGFPVRDIARGPR